MLSIMYLTVGIYWSLPYLLVSCYYDYMNRLESKRFLEYLRMNLVMALILLVFWPIIIFLLLFAFLQSYLNRTDKLLDILDADNETDRK